MKLLIIFCLVLATPLSFAQSRTEEIETSFERIESFREIAPGEFKFSPSLYREGRDMALAGFNIFALGSAAHVMFHSSKYGRWLGFVQLLARSTVGISAIVMAVGVTADTVEVVNATLDGYRRILPRVGPNDSLAHILMGSPQGYQSLIRMIKDPVAREEIRALALQDDEFYKFLTEFGTNRPRRKGH